MVVDLRKVELRACPFCRSKKLDDVCTRTMGGAEEWWFYCADCRASGPTASSRGEAGLAWNGDIRKAEKQVGAVPDKG